MTPALLTLAFGTFFFVLYASVCVVETNRGKRFYGTYIRRAADNGLDALRLAIERRVIYIGRYIITLSWYYSLHAFLKLVLQFLAGVYTVVEAVLHRNRIKVRRIRTERKQVNKSHLSVLADHKVQTELTPLQKEKRKAKALAGK